MGVIVHVDFCSSQCNRIDVLVTGEIDVERCGLIDSQRPALVVSVVALACHYVCLYRQHTMHTVHRFMRRISHLSHVVQACFHARSTISFSCSASQGTPLCALSKL